ncbi:MAG: zinc ribbon domain-containing protein [Nitrososphaerales archaeon]
MAFCPNCGKEVSPEAFACPNCGHPLRQFQPIPRPNEPVSGLWWLVPFFFAWIGGLIAYFVLKDRNRETAEHMLIFGIVWTFVGGIIVGFLLFGLFFAVAVPFR